MTHGPDTQARAQQCRKAGPFHTIIPQGGPLLRGQTTLQRGRLVEGAPSTFPLSLPLAGRPKRSQNR